MSCLRFSSFSEIIHIVQQSSGAGSTCFTSEGKELILLAPKNMEKSPRQKVAVTTPGDAVENMSVDSNKKIIRRDMERHRRQEMANLNASLRSMLPLDYVKGKRSVSDHMQEAVNYINHLQMRIRDLGSKRDELRNQSNMSASDHSESGSCGGSIRTGRHCVTISPFMDGVEILITGGFREERLLLSEVMEVLLQEGLSVHTCVSTKVNGGFLHTIECKVISDTKGFDVSVLQQKLWNVLTPSSSSICKRQYIS